MSKKNILIDCQVLQTSDRLRGMGLYIISLLRSIAEHKPTDINFMFVINSSLKELELEDKELLNELGEIKQAKLLSRKDHSFFSDAVEKNKKIIDRIMSTCPENTIFFIPALFSSEIYSVFPTNSQFNLLLFYDIIPFLYAEQYFRDPNGYNLKDYSQRWREAYKTNLFLTISQTTADDLTIYFGIDPNRIVPILGAGIIFNNLSPIKPAIKELSNDFILMPSGDDFRKNNELAVRAFASLNTKVKLVITSNFSKETKRILQTITPNVIFSGSVSSSEMIWLIDNARFIFFPSQYEGLGMPILEAVNRKAIIACSYIPVFKEISNDAFCYFNPKSQASIAKTLKDALKIKKTDININLYKKIQDKFSWNKTAKLFLNSLNEIKKAGNKKRLAIFCPSPSSYSAVGKYAFEMHGELSQYFDIDYFYENGQTEFKPTRPNILDGAAYYRPVSEFKFRNNKYDTILYHIGNSEFHTETILSALSYGANAIIHDSFLNGIFDYMVRYKYLTATRRKLETIIDNKIMPTRSKFMASIVTNQKAVFCHSNYVKKGVVEISNKLKVYQTAQPVGVPKMFNAHRGFNVSFAGIIQESKGLNLIAEIVELENVNVRVFGFGSLGRSPILQGLSSNIKVLYDISDKDFQDYLRETDILVNYRVNYHGETSRSALEAMRFGAVVIVNNVGWFAELPDDCVVKVNNETELVQAVQDLLMDSRRRQKIGEAARKFLAEKYSFGRYAKLMVDKLEGK